MGKGDPWSPRTSILHEEQKICNNDAVMSGLDIACLSPDTEFLFRKFGFQSNRGPFVRCGPGKISYREGTCILI